MNQISISCRCGNVKGTLRAKAFRRHNHLKCYCRDCQAFARFIGNDGTLDAQGGTEIVQLNGADVKITEGEGALDCVNLKGGRLPRFYASCCNTPIGNAPGPGMPFVGLIHDCLQPADQMDTGFGPVKMLWLTEHATCDDKPRSKGVLSGIVRFLVIILSAKLRGDGKRHPFFTSTGEPRVPVTVLSTDEREKA